MMGSVMTCTYHQMLIGWSDLGNWDVQGRWHMLGRREVYAHEGKFSLRFSDRNYFE